MKSAILVATTFLSLSLFANDVTVKSAKIQNSKGKESKLSIGLVGNLNDNPRVKIEDKILNITIPNSGLSGKINTKSNGTTLSAKMVNEAVEISIELPYSLSGRESDVTIALKDGSIDVNYPRLTPPAVKPEVSRAPSVTKEVETVKNNKEAEVFDEKYLAELEAKHLEETKKVEAPKAEIAQVDTRANDTDRVNVAQASVQKGEVKTTETSSESGEKSTSSGFSMVGYVGKFVAFLSLMIAGFYGVLALFRKGVIKKGKLGFLHSTKMVEVLSTTHIAPKRSLMMVKAHKQVFLIASSETGIQYLSEISDVTGLIKSSEQEITGSNFDSNLATANVSDRQFRLKEESTSNNLDNDFAMESLDDMLNDSVPNAAKAIERNPIQDQVKFSDQIKSRVKNLKQL